MSFRTAAKKLLPDAVAARLRPLRNSIRNASSHIELALSRGARPSQISALKPGPIVVTVLTNDERGLGHAARSSAATFKALGYDVIEHDAAPFLFDGEEPTQLAQANGGVWLLHLNPPEMRRVIKAHPLLSNAPMLRIGFWYWELPKAPKDWLTSARYVHEIWAATKFVATAFSEQSSATVRRIPFPMALPPAAIPDRERFGLKSGSVVFLAMADARSSLSRKNPEGAIQAFCRAFPEETADATLMVKILAPDAFSEEMAKLRAAARHRRDIRFLTARLSGEDTHRLLDSVDAILSLHRSEGLGLTPAEAMARGKAVIITPWSGVEDFIDAECVAPVAYKLVPVADSQGIYSSMSQVWAEPDVDDAANWIKTLTYDAELRAQLGARARAAIESYMPARWDTINFGGPFDGLAQKKPTHRPDDRTAL